MLRSSNKRAHKRARVRRTGGRRGEAGLTMLEVVVVMSLTALAFTSVHLTVGTSVMGKLLVSNRVSNQQQGRLVVEWIADRVRQAGFGTSGSIARCQDKIATVNPYLPTSTQLFINADVRNTGVPETHGFQIETVSGSNVVTETVIPCVAGAVAVDQPVVSPTSAQASALSFAYYDAKGNAVTSLTSPAAIRTIRYVTVTVQVQAAYSTRPGLTRQTWTARVDLRNP